MKWGNIIVLKSTTIIDIKGIKQRKGEYMKYPHLSMAIFKTFPGANFSINEIDKKLQAWNRADKWEKAEAPKANIANATHVAFKHRHDEGFKCIV